MSEPLEYCRRDLGPEANYRHCGKPAEFIVWGKLFPKEVLGPRCYDCAFEQVGYHALHDDSYAVFHLRGLNRSAPHQGAGRETG